MMRDQLTGYHCDSVRYYDAADFEPLTESGDVGGEVDTLCREFRLEHGGSYQNALESVLQERPELKRAYAFNEVDVNDETRNYEAGKDLDQQAREYMAKHDVSYSVAFERVLNAPQNESLKRDYAQVD